MLQTCITRNATLMKHYFLFIFQLSIFISYLWPRIQFFHSIFTIMNVTFPFPLMECSTRGNKPLEVMIKSEQNKYCKTNVHTCTCLFLDEKLDKYHMQLLTKDEMYCKCFRGLEIMLLGIA